MTAARPMYETNVIAELQEAKSLLSQGTRDGLRIDKVLRAAEHLSSANSILLTSLPKVREPQDIERLSTYLHVISMASGHMLGVGMYGVDEHFMVEEEAVIGFWTNVDAVLSVFPD